MQAGGVQVLDGRLQVPETLPEFGRFRRSVGRTPVARRRSRSHLAFFTFDPFQARRSLPPELGGALFELGGFVLPSRRQEFLDFGAQPRQFALDIVTLSANRSRRTRLVLATALGCDVETLGLGQELLGFFVAAFGLEGLCLVCEARGFIAPGFDFSVLRGGHTGPEGEHGDEQGRCDGAQRPRGKEMQFHKSVALLVRTDPTARAASAQGAGAWLSPKG